MQVHIFPVVSYLIGARPNHWYFTLYHMGIHRINMNINTNNDANTDNIKRKKERKIRKEKTSLEVLFFQPEVDIFVQIINQPTMKH